ncbi:MAG: AAA family ATPase [Nanoarchaeota archaeon]|nr:AAA family ATPase [Nanoarchaeota archaeon]
MSKPYYIIMRGPLGSGKSTISGQLAREINATHISIDRILDEFGLTKDKEAGYISQKSFLKANQIAVERILPMLKEGKIIIFDGNFYWKSQLEDLLNKLKFKHFVFTLKISLEECIKRDSGRNPPHGEGAARAVYKKTTEFSHGIEIDATKPLKEIVKEIITYLPK